MHSNPTAKEISTLFGGKYGLTPEPRLT
jgi:hypothetical protein